MSARPSGRRPAVLTHFVFHVAAVSSVCLTVGSSPSSAFAQQGNEMPACLRGADPEARIAACTRVIENARDPRAAARAHNARGLALCDANRCADAVADFEKVVRAFPSIAGYLDNYARALRSAKRPAEAVAAAQRAVALAPGQAFVYVVEAHALEDAGRLEDALHALDRAAQLARTRSGIFGYRGKILGELARFPEADAAFAAATEAAARENTPLPAAFYEERAEVEMSEGRRDDAIQDLEQYPTSGSDAKQVRDKLLALRDARAERNGWSSADAPNAADGNRASAAPATVMNTPPIETSPTTCNFYNWQPVQRCIEDFHTDNDTMPDGDPNPKHWNDTLAAEGKALAAQHPGVAWDHAAWNAIVVKHDEDAASERAELEYHRNAANPADGDSPKVPSEEPRSAELQAAPNAVSNPSEGTASTIDTCDAPEVLSVIKKLSEEGVKKQWFRFLMANVTDVKFELTGIRQLSFDAESEHRVCAMDRKMVVKHVSVGQGPSVLSVPIQYQIDRQLDGDRGSYITCKCD